MPYYVKSPNAKKRPYWTGEGWTSHKAFVRIFDSVEEANAHMASVAGAFRTWSVVPVDGRLTAPES